MILTRTKNFPIDIKEFILYTIFLDPSLELLSRYNGSYKS
jgi:hypothetical protein